MKPSVRRILVFLWSLAVTLGMGGLIWRSQTPAAAKAAVVGRWPATVAVVKDDQRLTLVMAVHPHCFCSRASINELSVLLAHAAGRLTAHVLFVVPHGAPLGWEEGALLQKARAIPGASVTIDTDGHDADAFGATTSGEVAVYDPRGVLLFAGGITSGRGHEGDNDGVDAILSLIAHRAAGSTTTPVYGCELKGDSSNPSQR